MMGVKCEGEKGGWEPVGGRYLSVAAEEKDIMKDENENEMYMVANAW